MENTEVNVSYDDLRVNQNLGLAVGGGILAAIIGAAIWAGITMVTGYQIGWVAIGIGFIVGTAVRKLGKGVQPHFGIIAAVLALLGCAGGNIAAFLLTIAKYQDIAVFELVKVMDFTIFLELLKESIGGRGILFYGLAIFEAYKIGYVKINK